MTEQQVKLHSLSPIQQTTYKQFIALPQVEDTNLDELAAQMRIHRRILDSFMDNEPISIDALIRIHGWLIKIQGKK